MKSIYWYLGLFFGILVILGMIILCIGCSTVKEVTPTHSNLKYAKVIFYNKGVATDSSRIVTTF